MGFDFLLFSGVIWSPPLCFLKIIGTSELILDQNLYPVPRFEFRILGVDFLVFSGLQVSHMVVRVWLTLEHNL